MDGVVDTDDVDEINDDIIFVDDDRWKFCQHVGMNLGYFWYLTECKQLTDECTQNCAGVGVTMGNYRETSSSNSSSSTKKGKDKSL